MKNCTDTYITWVCLRNGTDQRKVCITIIRLYNTLRFFSCKNENYQLNILDIFLIFAQNIDCRYKLELPHSGASNEYTSSMFQSKNKKIVYTPVNPNLTLLKWSVRGSKLQGRVIMMNRWLKWVKSTSGGVY